jgi:hypothetical protein
MSFSIIVARYYENVEWTKQFPNVIIYNKGSELDDTYNQVFLNNVGREGHTYYKYICDNYDHLPDYTFFLQGNPFDHSPNIISNLNNYINDTSSINHFQFLSEGIHYSSLEDQRKTYGECQNIHNNWQRTFGEIVDINHECIFGAGAQFIVSKNQILKRPKEFYNNIVQMLEYDINPLEGYDIERFHKYIFN